MNQPQTLWFAIGTRDFVHVRYAISPQSPLASNAAVANAVCLRIRIEDFLLKAAARGSGERSAVA